MTLRAADTSSVTPGMPSQYTMPALWQLLLVLICVVSIAFIPGSSARAATISFTPAFSNNDLGEGATFSASFTFAGTEYYGAPAPVTNVTVHLPAGVEGEQAGFPTCEETTLATYGPAGCPTGSIAGPVGSISAAFDIAGELIHENGTIQAVFAPGEKLFFFIQAVAPVAIEVIAGASYVKDAPPYSRVLSLELPLIESLPGAPYMSITALNIELGASHEEGHMTIHSVTIPEECPQSGEFMWASDLAFYEQTPQHPAAETVCPNSSGKHKTTTILQVSVAGPSIGELTTYTAIVLPELTEHMPSGTVEFLDQGSPINGCSAQPLTEGTSSSTATCQVSYSEAGEHDITAAYTGDTNFFGSSSPAHAISVRPASISNSGDQNNSGTGTTKTSSGTSSTSNAGSTTSGQNGTPHSVKPLTQTQKLAKALKGCQKERPKSRRKICEAQAKKRYGKPKKKTKKKH